MFETDNPIAERPLADIGVAWGQWYINSDGRITIAEAINPDSEQQKFGTGYRARFLSDNEFGWGPLSQYKADAVTLLLAEYIGMKED